MRRVLGVDGGQSGTRLRDSHGREAGAQGVSRSEGDAVAALMQAVTAAWRQAGFDPVDRVVLGLTTAPGDRASADRLCTLVAGLTGATEVWLADDAVTAHAGALSLGWGVSVVAGTGVCCLVMTEHGPGRILGGHGYLLGDEGGAFWIGRQALADVLRAREGRIPLEEAAERHVLASAAERRFGPLDGLHVRVHSMERPVHAIAGFARDVLEAADAGDPLAGSVLDDAAQELVLLVAAAARWATDDGPSIPLALGGRLLADGTALRRRLEHELQRAHLDVVVRSADGSGLDGALSLGQLDDPGRYADLVHCWRQAVPA